VGGSVWRRSKSIRMKERGEGNRSAIEEKKKDRAEESGFYTKTDDREKKLTEGAEAKKISLKLLEAITRRRGGGRITRIKVFLSYGGVDLMYQKLASAN